MTPVGGVVAVHAHPDDETLSTGALLATCARAGRPVAVVTCTRGERGEVIGDALAHLEGDGPALAAHRETELTAALTALGVQEHVYLDAVDPAGRRYEDSGMAWLGTGRAGHAADLPADAFVGVAVEEAAALLAEILRTRRPDVVVTYEPDGGYGHPDHVHAHRVTARAVELVAADGLTPTVLWAAQRRADLRTAYAALGSDAVTRALGAERSDLTLPDPDGALPSVAVDHVDLVVDVAPVRDAVLDAMRAHATQVRAVRAVDGAPALVGCYALSNDVLAPLLPVEGYRVAAGRADALAGVPGVRPVA